MPILRRSVVQFCSAPLVRFHTALDTAGLGATPLAEYVDFSLATLALELPDFTVVSREKKLNPEDLPVEIVHTSAFAGLLIQGGTLKKCVNSQAVYPLSETTRAQGPREEIDRLWEREALGAGRIKAGVGPVGGLGSRSGPGADPGVAGGRGDGVSRKGEVGPQEVPSKSV